MKKISLRLKTVLLTGGAGFIGHHTIEHFLKITNWNVIVLDRLSYAGNLNRIIDIECFDDNKERVKFYYHDFKSQFDESKIKQLKSLFGDIDYIVHMGANSHVDKSIKNPYPFVYDNVLGTVNILELAKNINIEKMIYVSTDEVYGPVEGDFLHKETEPLKPGNPYSASKASGENFCISYHNTYNVPVIITRTMNNFGERQDSEKFLPRVVNSIKNNELLTIHCKIEDGRVVDISSRCWLHARNHADAIVFLLENGEDGEIYNVVGERMNVHDLALKVGEILKKDIKIKLEDFHSFRPGHDMHYGLSGEKLLNMGWKPPTSLKTSLEKTVLWMINNPNWL